MGGNNEREDFTLDDFGSNNMDYDELYQEAERLSNNGDYQRAISVYRDAIVVCLDSISGWAQDSSLGCSYIGIGRCYKKLGDEEKANEYLAKGCDKLGDFYMKAPTPTGSLHERYEADKKAQEYYDKAKNFRGDACFVTTAVCYSFGKPDDCYELTTFRNFRDTWLAAQPDGKSLIAEYYAIAPRIVANINRLADAAQIYKSIWQKYLEPCLNFIRSGDNLSCKNKYVEMIHELKKIYG